MTDHMKVLNELKPLQVSPGEVECTCSDKCWCGRLSFRSPIDQVFDECLSPTEMLDTYGSQMDEDDIKYLKSLSNKTFIS